VNIPNVGVLKIGGLTVSQAEELVLEKVRGAFKKAPVVTVRFVDYKISVLGEVVAPGSYTIKTGKVNVFQALALARDLTIYGQRENVKIIREEANGEKKVYEVNLNDAFLLTSPLYYLQRNDVVYVTPNKPKSRNADMSSTTSMWISGTSIGISLINLILNIAK
jgi:polysaccharide export outer membrane protein